MKKALSLVSLVIISLSNAYAEDRLFPTDILNKGEIDARLILDHDTNSSDISFKGNTGHSSLKNTTEDLQVRYGLGSSWHIGLSLPYASQSVVNTDYSNPPAHYSNKGAQGGQNPIIWATYGILNDKASAFSLNAEALVSPDTTGNVKTSYTGRLTSGWKTSDTLRLYAGVSATTYDDANVANTYALRGGAYMALSETLTLIPHVSYVQFASTDTYSSFGQTALGLSANVKLATNVYLIPDIVFYRNGDGQSDNGYFHREATNNGKHFSLAAYYLF